MSLPITAAVPLLFLGWTAGVVTATLVFNHRRSTRRESMTDRRSYGSVKDWQRRFNHENTNGPVSNPPLRFNRRHGSNPSPPGDKPEPPAPPPPPPLAPDPVFFPDPWAAHYEFVARLCNNNAPLPADESSSLIRTDDGSDPGIRGYLVPPPPAKPQPSDAREHDEPLC